MKEYDHIIFGAGTAGLTILSKALASGGKTALINEGPIGGTCFNTGCVPSKILVSHADLINTIRTAPKLGIKAEISQIDFGAIMARMRRAISKGRKSMEEWVRNSENLDYYPIRASFKGDCVIDAGGELIRGRKVFITTGSRDKVPPIKGLDSADFLTHTNVLELNAVPESMIIIGGGYIAMEYAHFFEAMGAGIVVLEAADRLVSHEEPEISDLLLKELEKRMEIHTAITIREVRKTPKGYAVSGENETGKVKEFSAERVFLAVGRESNADTLMPENTAVETDQKNYIKVNQYLETSNRNIWAAGDAIDNLMFTHSGDREAEIAWENATENKRVRMDFNIVPHAVNTQPQVASIGMTEEQARENSDVLVGVAEYSDLVYGEAMGVEAGFAKAVVEKDTGRILGFHIIGPHAAILLQEVANVMAKGGTVGDITRAMHIFPTLAELVPEALGKIKEIHEPAHA